MTKDSQVVADQLGLLLQRGFRQNLYAGVVGDVHPAVDIGVYPILSGLARYGEATAAILGAEIGVDRALVSRKAATLIEAGLLTSRTDPNDRRKALLTLTEEGEQVVDQLRRRLVGVVEHRLRGWAAADRRQLARLFTRLVTALGSDVDATPHG